VKELSDDYECEEINSRLSIDICLNYLSGNYEIEIYDKEYTIFKLPINNSIKDFMEIFNQAESLFDKKIDSLFDRIDNWESSVAKADRQREMDIELKIDELRMKHNNYILE
ncbi:hypothetical protein D9V86_10575, partial [Bacteroidetes/Chlorobi group bacterium ChocPot_Mid]